jgi:hypothetical protein
MLYGIPGGEGQGGGKGLGEGGELTAGNASKHNPHYMLTRFLGPQQEVHFVLHKSVLTSVKKHILSCHDVQTKRHKV